MKRKFEISHESGFDLESGPTRSVIKTFKNQPDALAFYNDPRNLRRYGTLFLTVHTEDGRILTWDDRKENWQ